jgi:DNA-binding response OmpR family regulator
MMMKAPVKVYRLYSGKNNYDIDTAKTGQEALEKAYGRFYNVILMDIKLPDMEGIELLSALKESMRIQMCLLLLHTPLWRPRKRAINEGASGYITKPINVNEVLTTLKEPLKNNVYRSSNYSNINNRRDNYRSETDNRITGIPVKPLQCYH